MVIPLKRGASCWCLALLLAWAPTLHCSTPDEFRARAEERKQHAAAKRGVIVSAASEDHLCALVNLLKSLNASSPEQPVLVYDLTMAPPSAPSSQHPGGHGSGQYGIADADFAPHHGRVLPIRRFNYDAYPEHVAVSRSGGAWASSTATTHPPTHLHPWQPFTAWQLPCQRLPEIIENIVSRCGAPPVRFFLLTCVVTACIIDDVTVCISSPPTVSCLLLPYTKIC